MTHYYEGWPATQRAVNTAGSHSGLRQFGTLLLLALGLATGSVQGQLRPAPNFFQADGAARTAAAASPLAATLTHSQALTLDVAGLRAALATAPLESWVGAAPLVLTLPQPDGTTSRFALREAPIMEPALAARYPQIKTYAGIGLDDVTATVRLDLTPRGFHAQVLSSMAPGFLVGSVSPTDTRHCLSYYQKDVKPAAGQSFRCGSRSTSAEEQTSAAGVVAWRAAGGAAVQSTGAQLRTYRLALACTPQYALLRGNTKAGVLAAEVVTINQVVGTYERELAVRLVLVANNDQITFLSGAGPQPSPTYTNNDVEKMLDENQPNVDRVIGSANYDIGYVFGTPRQGGIAGLGAVCLDGQKARGAGDDIVYITRHEIGHQLGALHSFNTINAGRNDLSAWEPGSGITIMSYAGLYGPSDDAQPNVEEVFHTGSYESIQAMMSRRGCGTLAATGNTPPVVTVPASGKTLPISTPFKLTAMASDANNDPLTYSWEGLDRGPAGNLSLAQVTNQTPPLFRSWLPVTSSTRYFPRLAELVNNTAALGERLPTVSRKLRFRCTVRDQHVGVLGVVGGVTPSDSVNLLVSAAAGPFVVTAPNAALTWAGGATQPVSWTVANTNIAPVSCARVNLRLSLDGGLTYPTVLATGVNNSGTANITVPNVATTTARVMVEAADNYFFDISNANFTITLTPGPVITSLNPAAGPVGTLVTLTGSNLTGVTGLTINGLAVTGFTVVSGTSMSFTVPAGAATGNVVVTTGGGVSNGVVFTVRLPAPVITSLNRAMGPVGTVVTLAGSNFTGATGLTLNGLAVTGFTVVSGTSVTFTVPAGATTGNVVVTTSGGASNGVRFTVTVVSAMAAANATGFSVWPNPVGTEAALHVRLAASAATARVSLRNGLGQLVGTREFSGSTTELSTAGLASGLYLLSVQADGHVPTMRRVVVE